MVGCLKRLHKAFSLGAPRVYPLPLSKELLESSLGLNKSPFQRGFKRLCKAPYWGASWKALGKMLCKDLCLGAFKNPLLRGARLNLTQVRVFVKFLRKGLHKALKLFSRQDVRTGGSCSKMVLNCSKKELVLLMKGNHKWGSLHLYNDSTLPLSTPRTVV